MFSELKIIPFVGFVKMASTIIEKVPLNLLLSVLNTYFILEHE